MLQKIISFFTPHIASAHEAYVVDSSHFWGELQNPFSLHAFDALKSSQNIQTTLIIVVSVLIFLALNFAFRRSRAGERFSNYIEQFAKYGPLFVRFSIAAAFFFSAISHSFLGPELVLADVSFGSLISWVLIIISIMIAFGIFTELAALAGIIIFVVSFFHFGPYVFTYLNYLGELLVLVLFGMRIFSVDRFLFGPLRRLQWFEKYETVIVRVFYGVALIYAAITVKFLHPELTTYVVEHWNLTQFQWLFPADPLLVTLGAGIVEAVIGLFIIFGFEMRLTVLISLFYITLSLIFFRELVWPHLLLYGISLNLLVQPEIFTLDHIMFKHHRRKKRWWLRPFMPHVLHGKSKEK